MCSTSPMRGPLSRMHSSRTSSAAAIAPIVAFFEPLTAISPRSRCPPSMMRAPLPFCGAIFSAPPALNARLSRPRAGPAPPSLRYLQPDQCPLQLCRDAGQVHFGLTVLQLALGLAARLFRARDVDLLRAFGGIRQ